MSTSQLLHWNWYGINTFHFCSMMILYPFFSNQYINPLNWASNYISIFHKWHPIPDIIQSPLMEILRVENKPIKLNCYNQFSCQVTPMKPKRVFEIFRPGFWAHLPEESPFQNPVHKISSLSLIAHIEANDQRLEHTPRALHVKLCKVDISYRKKFTHQQVVINIH